METYEDKIGFSTANYLSGYGLCEKDSECNTYVIHTCGFSHGFSVDIRAAACETVECMDATKRRTKLWDYVRDTVGRDVIKKNVGLIKTIEPDKFPLIVRGIVKVFKKQMTRDELVAWIEKVGEVDTERAEIIADDQIAKASVVFQLLKWRDQGWRRVQWRHSKGVKEPRKYHTDKWDGVSGKEDGKPNALNGYVFPMGRPPVIDQKTGERGYPAQLINCRCYLVPFD